MKAYMGIDIGTSAVKVVLVAEKGKVIGSGAADFALSTPRPGYAEQNSREWWTGTVQAVRQAIAACGGDVEVGGIGVSGQMVGSVLMDKDGQAEDQCIIWMDQRAAKQRDGIESALTIETILDKTANFPLVSLWVPKLLWLRENEPELYSRIDKILFPKDYIKYQLTGVYDIDVTDATASMLFNPVTRSWEDSLFDAFDIPKSFIPSGLSESTDIIGRVSQGAARELGLPPGIPVVGGGGDQMCGAVGLGIVRPGMVSATIGTSGCVFTHSDTCIVDRKPRALLSYCHSVPGTWCLYGCTLSAGGAYQWLAKTFFKNSDVRWETGGRSIYEFMDTRAASSEPGCQGVVFLPYLSGERTPHPDPNARGVFFGISHTTGAGEMCRAVMEGVAYSLKDTVEIFREYGLPVANVRAAGGGAASDLWLQIQADIYGTTVTVANVVEAPAVGAAILAAVGAGGYSDVGEAVDDIVAIVREYEPNPKCVMLYNDYYESYTRLYPALRDVYASQADKVERWT